MKYAKKQQPPHKKNMQLFFDLNQTRFFSLLNDCESVTRRDAGTYNLCATCIMQET